MSEQLHRILVAIKSLEDALNERMDLMQAEIMHECAEIRRDLVKQNSAINDLKQELLATSKIVDRERALAGFH